MTSDELLAIRARLRRQIEHWRDQADQVTAEEPPGDVTPAQLAALVLRECAHDLERLLVQILQAESPKRVQVSPNAIFR